MDPEEEPYSEEQLISEFDWWTYTPEGTKYWRGVRNGVETFGFNYLYLNDPTSIVKPIAQEADLTNIFVQHLGDTSIEQHVPYAIKKLAEKYDSNIPVQNMMLTPLQPLKWLKVKDVDLARWQSLITALSFAYGHYIRVK
jgi:hypothetical protein